MECGGITRRGGEKKKEEVREAERKGDNMPGDAEAKSNGGKKARLYVISIIFS